MSRQAFEEWLNPGHHAGNVSPWVEPGRYEKETHQLAWLSWQAWQAATNAALQMAADECLKHRSAEEAANAIRKLKYD